MRRSLTPATLLAALAIAAPAGAAVDGGCNPGNRPGATLLFPHFRVALDDPGGANTLISVGNDGETATVAHVVLWTDRAIPTLAFDLYLAPGDLQTLSLRDVLLGRFPETGGVGAEPIPGCGAPVEVPVLDAAALAALHAAHTGRPGPGGLCAGSGAAGAAVALGYVTVDAMNRCTGEGVSPRSEGYFAPGGTGLASNRNVLWGDLLLVESSEGFAQGVEAVQVTADAALYGEEQGSFYRVYSGGADQRAPLEGRYRARFVQGGGFDGGTELVLWAADLTGAAAPTDCDPPPSFPVATESWFALQVFDEAGHLRLVEIFDSGPALSRLLTLGAGGVAPPVPFGFVEVEHVWQPPCFFPSCFPEPVQAWVAPVMKASGRYSVGFRAARPEQSCLDIAP